MPKKPYPGCNPSVKTIIKKGGLHRSCFVVDVLSHEELSNTQQAVIEEHVQAYINKLVNLMPAIEAAEIIHPERFDPILQEGLRLKKPDK